MNFWFQIKFITEDYNRKHKRILILNETKESIFNRKVYTTDWEEGTKRGLAWKIETSSILIKEKRKHLSKTLDRVAKMLQLKRLKFGFQRKES